MPVIGLENVERPEYGTVTVDLDLLRDQINWLASLHINPPDVAGGDAQQGILNLLEGIQDLTDPPEDSEEVETDGTL